MFDHFTLTDVAHKVVGVGSVGTRAWILLFEAGPVVVEGVEGHSRGASHRILVGEQRDPARQIRVLDSGDGGVAVVDVLQRVDGTRIEKAGARGRRHDQDAAVEGPGALQLLEHEVRATLQRVRRLEAGVHPDGFHRIATVEPVESWTRECKRRLDPVTKLAPDIGPVSANRRLLLAV